MKLVRVEEAVERKPFNKARVVEVEFSPVPRVVNGKLKDEPALPQPVQLVTVRLPIVAVLALRSEVVALTMVVSPPLLTLK